MEEEDNFSRSFRNAVHQALSSKFENVRQLKPVQEEALLQFIRRKDVFCVLPTGCGKSLIFQLVPLVCAYLHNEKFSYPEKPILLVICSLSALVESQIQELAIYGILSCYLGDDGLIAEEISQHSIVFISPELIVREERWRKLLQSHEFQDNLFGLVTDEAHVVLFEINHSFVVRNVNPVL
ncbi:ATP-dependent DNA helicase Q1-like [Montipora capricornis]|uniref:ATP-dependent DNA helicase Q1-like n=1 Tax=Montipora capricornis TaxID=246305 RepID=UPI0035F1D1FB